MRRTVRRSGEVVRIVHVGRHLPSVDVEAAH
jgi:hypothetical protein